MLALKRWARSRSITATIFARAQGKRASKMPSIFPDSCRNTFDRCFAKAAVRFAGWRFPAIPKISPYRPAGARAFPKMKRLRRWIELARERIHFQGFPARICWLGYGERAKFGLAMNDLVRTRRIKAPIVIGRDHLDTGSVASPYRETEAMLDGSDAIADWPLLNALVNTAAGASWVHPQRRRSRHRLLAACRHGGCRGRHGRGTDGSNACSPPILEWVFSPRRRRI